VTVNVPVWGTLFVTVSEYEPAANPAGSVAISFWFVYDNRASAVWAKATVGAGPNGLKLAPLMVMVMRLFVVFTTALKITGAVALQAGAPRNMTNAAIRNCLSTSGSSFVDKEIV
jgi:hypothetical protein